MAESLLFDISGRASALTNTETIKLLRDLYGAYYPFMIPPNTAQAFSDTDKKYQVPEQLVYEKTKEEEYKIPKKITKDVGARHSKYWDADKYVGMNIYAPVYLDGQVMPPCLLSIQSKKNIIRTPLVERAGSVKELINIEDYKFTLRGFIPPDKSSKQYNETWLQALITLYEKRNAVELRNVITDLCFPPGNGAESFYVVIESLEFPNTQHHVLPYTMELETDNISELIII